jgi:hypothetical protein
MKALGFRRVGWMTWETGPELRAEITEQILTLPGVTGVPADLDQPSSFQYPHGVTAAQAAEQFDWLTAHAREGGWTAIGSGYAVAPPGTPEPTLSEFLKATHRPSRWDDPDEVERFCDAILTPSGQAGPVVNTPWADLGYDVLADIHEVGQERPFANLAGSSATIQFSWGLERMAALGRDLVIAAAERHAQIHCAPDVVGTLRCSAGQDGREAPMTLAILLGVDIIAEGDMEAGRWELRKGDTVIDSGRLEEL